MSKKNKAQKEQGLSQIQNPVIIKIFIQTDDDFTVNGQFQLKQELHFASLEEMHKGVFTFFDSLNFRCEERTMYRLTSFLEFVRSAEFKADVELLGTLLYPDTPFATYAEKAETGGNQYIIINVLSRGDSV